VLNMAVFCSFLTSYFPGTLLTYFLNDFEIVPITPIIIIIIIIIRYHLYAWYLKHKRQANHISRLYSSASVLYLQFILL